MREIVYYEGNPTIKNLVASKLRNAGHTVVCPSTIFEVEDSLRQCRKPAFLIVDMSRHPDYLPVLQQFAGSYVTNSERCLLTSVTPSALAQYLPQNISQCFFSHVVEKPFKTPELVALIENILCSNPPTLSGNTGGIILSGIEQITRPEAGRGIQNEHDRHCVEDVVNSVSLSVDSPVIDPSMQPARGVGNRSVREEVASVTPVGVTGGKAYRVTVHTNDVSGGRVAGTLGQVGASPAHPSGAVHEIVLPPLDAVQRGDPLNVQLPPLDVQPLAESVVQERVHRREITPRTGRSGLRYSRVRTNEAELPDGRSWETRPSTEASPDTGRSSSSVHRSVSGEVADGALPEAAEVVPDAAPVQLPAAVETGDNSGEGEEYQNSTMVFSRSDMVGGGDVITPSVRLMASSSGQLTLFTWADVLRRSCMTGQRLTLEIGNPPGNLVIIIDMGYAIWVENCATPSPKSLREYLQEQASTLTFDPEVVNQQLDKLEECIGHGENPTSALMTTDLFNRLLPALEASVSGQVVHAAALRNATFKIYEGNSRLAELLTRQRPSVAVAIPPIVFNQCRSSDIGLGAFRFRKFRARPDRTILNFQIRLTDEEQKIVSILAKPQNIQSLNEALGCDASRALPALLLFDFIDMVI